jgi:prevent-host-death family protein
MSVSTEAARGLRLGVDLQRGVVPISKAASALAALFRRARTEGQPIIITQKGYPTGVILDIELFSALKAIAEGADDPLDGA